jgi:hypothetical protein
MGKRILVCGGRDFDDWGLLLKGLEEYVGKFRGPNPDITIIQGGAKGADFLARAYAKWVGFNQEEFPADWKSHGKRAGMLRNKQMLDEGKPDLVLAFPGGSGTANMVALAKAANVPVIEIQP